ncbi:hypothetical protein GTQ99_05410 [Kineococcus sp. T13]|uniref:hypothetical protein n=1 Tax=Kineococcus vitellinus TaxID=2696565 RepID=UPI0014120567|nr:hypothetical protein [Kineococcus vitellinus]NAZ74863.1 hypothetical protein [Kineococcus vitellinus]
MRTLLRAATPPVVLVGWSYGGDVVGLAAPGEQERRDAHASCTDVREVDCDHFILWRCPQTIADVIVQALQET